MLLYNGVYMLHAKTDVCYVVMVAQQGASNGTQAINMPTKAICIARAALSSIGAWQEHSKI